MAEDETGAVTRRAVHIVHVEVDEADVEELNRWYSEEHAPEKLAQPGYLSMRRFRAADGSPKFLALYELDDAAAADFPDPKTYQSSDWAKRTMATWKRWDRSVWVELDETGAG